MTNVSNALDEANRLQEIAAKQRRQRLEKQKQRELTKSSRISSARSPNSAERTPNSTKTPLTRTVVTPPSESEAEMSQYVKITRREHKQFLVAVQNVHTLVEQKEKLQERFDNTCADMDTLYKKLQLAEKAGGGTEECTKLREECTKLRQENTKLADQKKNLIRENNELVGNNKKVQGNLNKALGEIDEMTAQLVELEQALANATKALRDGGNFSKKEWKKEILAAIKVWVKKTGYHKVKFAVGPQLEKFTKDCYASIKTNLGLDNKENSQFVSENEFVRIYHTYLSECLTNRRSYTTTKIFDAVIVFYHEHGNIPTVDEVTGVYDLGPLDAPNRKRKEAVFLWYAKHFLPACTETWMYGRGQKHVSYLVYKPTDSVKIGGVNVARVPMQSEAFGLLNYENGFPKWLTTVPLKAKDPSWTTPPYKKSDPHTYKYHCTKWSDSKSGQIKGGGWKKEAYAVYNERMQYIKTLRKTDKANGWKLMKAIKEILVKDAEKNDPKAYQSVFGGAKRKRNAPVTATARAPTYVEIDEMSDEYSVGSECSSGENNKTKKNKHGDDDFNE